MPLSTSAIVRHRFKRVPRLPRYGRVGTLKFARVAVKLLSPAPPHRAPSPAASISRRSPLAVATRNGWYLKQAAHQAQRPGGRFPGDHGGTAAFTGVLHRWAGWPLRTSPRPAQSAHFRVRPRLHSAHRRRGGRAVPTARLLWRRTAIEPWSHDGPARLCPTGPWNPAPVDDMPGLGSGLGPRSLTSPSIHGKPGGTDLAVMTFSTSVVGARHCETLGRCAAVPAHVTPRTPKAAARLEGRGSGVVVASHRVSGAVPLVTLGCRSHNPGYALWCCHHADIRRGCAGCLRR
jgi:hypothetical protein